MIRTIANLTGIVGFILGFLLVYQDSLLGYSIGMASAGIVGWFN